MASPAFILQTQQNWHWNAGEEIVKYYLDRDDIRDVRRWQQIETYTFEFHPSHETGNPIYIRPDGNSDNDHIPKVDTRNIVSPILHYVNRGKQIPDWLTMIANYNKLGVLTELARAEITNIFNDNWAVLQKLAARKYSAWVRPIQVDWVAVLRCTTSKCAGREVLVAVSSRAAANYIFFPNLGKCQNCRTVNWALVNVIAPPANRKIDVPFEATTPNPNRLI